MSDYKSAYSLIAKHYIENVVPVSNTDSERFNRSKEREKRFNQNWIRQKVDLNEVVERFIPQKGQSVVQRSEGGVKFNFEGTRYTVKCDKVAGYLRFYDKNLKSYCKMDGTPSRDNLLTHFKIKRREEM